MKARLLLIQLLLQLALFLLLPVVVDAAEFDRAISISPASTPLFDSSASKANCTLSKHNGTLSFYSDRYGPGMRTVTYFDPTACERASYPFSILNLQFTLYDAGSRPWPLKLQVVIYASSTDTCLGPSQELYRFPVRCDSATFRDPHVGTAWLPIPLCVNGPFYIGVEYASQPNGLPPYPSVAFDFSTPRVCDNWQYDNGQWIRWADFWTPPIPGYPLFWVTGEPGAVTNCSPDSSKMKINEISPYAGEFGSGTWTPSWVELFNSGAVSLTVNGFQLVGRSGSVIATLPNYTLPPRTYLRVNFSKGPNDGNFVDGKGTYYTQGDSVGIFSSAEDEIGMYKAAAGPQTIVDFVGWSSTGSFVGGIPYSHATAKSIWRAGEFVNASSHGSFSSFGLCPSGFDHNNPIDWREYDWGTYYSCGYQRIGNPIQTFPPNGGSLGKGSRLEWASVYGAVQYYLEVDQDSLFGNPAIAFYTIGTNYTLNGLAEGVYYWRVRVFDSNRLLTEHEDWKFYYNPNTTGPDSVYLSVAQKLQHKDTRLLCITNDNGYSPVCKRPGCSESPGTNGPWNREHSATFDHIVHCEHCSRYSARASLDMVNNFFGGTLKQDHISYTACEHIHPNAPEGDLGHQRFLWWSPADEIGSTLNWELNLTASSLAGKPTWTEIVTEISVNHHPLLICTPGQTMVLNGERTAAGQQQIHLVDPWPSKKQVGAGFRTGWWDYGSIEITHYYKLPAGTITGKAEAASLTSDTDLDSIVDFDEGLGPPAYGSDNPRKFQCYARSADSDSDQVSDFNEIRNYTFHDQPGFHPGHNNDALNFADIDSDGLRAEHDCDSDNDGLFDGGEDVNGNGRNPESGETCQFDNTSGHIQIRTNKSTYSVGEVIYVVDWEGVSETRTFHAGSTYNAEHGAGCPSKHDGDPLIHNSIFAVDDAGHALTSPVDTCPYVGMFYLCADVLNDRTYSSPDNLDPQVCWGCVADTSRGWHFGYDFQYNHPGQPWPPYNYPAVCSQQGFQQDLFHG